MCLLRGNSLTLCIFTYEFKAEKVRNYLISSMRWKKLTLIFDKPI